MRRRRRTTEGWDLFVHVVMLVNTLAWLIQYLALGAYTELFELFFDPLHINIIIHIIHMYVCMYVCSHVFLIHHLHTYHI